jgi:hypothetical protein
MNISGQINGKCVELTIGNCYDLGTKRIMRRNQFDGNNFIRETGITRRDIEVFFDDEMGNHLSNIIDVQYHSDKPMVRMTYGGVRWTWNYSTGFWKSSEYDTLYCCHSIREMIWDKIIGEDSHHIKSSFRLKREMICALMEM